MTYLLPNRYEDLAPEFKAHLRPNRDLIDLVQKAASSMNIGGGLRFLPIFGHSGSGKTSAAMELGRFLPQVHVIELDHRAVESAAELNLFLDQVFLRTGKKEIYVFVVDQYEEKGGKAADLPAQFVESLARLDRDRARVRPMLFLWLTTDRGFQNLLADATSRNTRILVKRDFELKGPDRSDWADIVEETFRFHNRDEPIADVGILREDLDELARIEPSLGEMSLKVGGLLGTKQGSLVDLSRYQVIILWPVIDATGISRVSAFTKSREGYKLDWNAWHRELPKDDRPDVQVLRALNAARLDFDVRLVPIAAADLQQLCRNLGAPDFTFHKTYRTRFENTQFYSILTRKWNDESFASLKERDSDRAKEAREWYRDIPAQSVKVGQRLAACLRELGLHATYEETVSSSHRKIRTDVYVEVNAPPPNRILVELKVYSSEQTIPSKIRDAIKSTLHKYAQFAGHLPRD